MLNLYNPKPIPHADYFNGKLWDHTLGDYSTPLIKVKSGSTWVTLPLQAVDAKYVITAIVNSGRNASGAVVGRQIGRVQMKWESMTFSFLYNHEWERILNIFKTQIEAVVKFYAPDMGRVIERKLYVGDRSAIIFAPHLDFFPPEDVLRPEIWKDCTVNFIDMGEAT